MTVPFAPRRPLTAVTAALLNQPPTQWLSPVRQLLDEQVELCLAFEQLSTQQSSLIAAGSIDDLIALLGRREELLERIVAIHRMLEPFHSRYAELLDELANSDRVSLQGRVDAVAGVVERIRVQDDVDRRALEQQRQSVADELAGMARVRGAAAAYGGGSPTSPAGVAAAYGAASRYQGPRG